MEPATPRLFLIDGYALIYRAFFALISRPLRTAQGENTSAAWGVVNFLLRLREKHKPDYLAWINDAGDSFRTAKFPAYKSTRQKLDAELQADFDRACERIDLLLHALGVPLVEVAGYEADDVIGTLATRAAAAGMQAVIVSGDKDFYQLIGPGVVLLNPGRGGPAAVEELWVDESNASERLGVPPGQVIDFLALVGDSSDNIPGVKGIGEKGAQKLLAEYGSLDAILANAERVEPKRAREALLANADNARLSRELVSIHLDVPVSVGVQELRPRPTDQAALTRLLTDLEFFTLVKKLVGPESTPAEGALVAAASPPAETTAAPAPAAAVAASAAPVVPVIDDPGLLPVIVARLREAPLVALDTETDSRSPRGAELIGLSLAASPTDVWYFPFGHRPQGGELAAPAPVKNLPPLSDPACLPLVALLTDPAVLKAGHHVKYDWQVLRGAGVELAGVAWDSMVAGFLLDSGRRSYGIDVLSLEYLGRAMQTYGDVAGRGKGEIAFAEIPVAAAAAYCGNDSATVLALHAAFAPALAGTPMGGVLENVEMPLVPVLVDMEWAGVQIDLALFKRLSNELARDLEQLQVDIAQVAGESLNLNSPRQLATVLFDKHQLPVLKKTKTGPSTDADVLEQLADMGHALPRLILSYRELQKLKSTYIDTLPLEVNPLTGRIHTSFNQTGAATGRLSSSDPNLQNIPVRSARGEAIRRGFVPAQGNRFVVADYSQIELRIMAHLSGDPGFIEAFQQGGDIHRQTAALIFNVPVGMVSGEQRARAKTINFATIYGQGPFALSKQLGITQDEAKQFIAQYFERFSGVRTFLDRQVELAREQGYVETLLGRRRYIPEVREKNFNLRSYGERNAQNSPLQGSAADLIKLAMIRIHTRLAERRLSSRMLLQVHDELVFEVPLAEVEVMEALVKLEMESVMPLRVPLVADVGAGDNWLDAKS
ncbi:MAG: polymerase [Gemmatimonadetes bacterium]|nr:polymerase [Gemmatimonadota bacterium]